MSIDAVSPPMGNSPARAMAKETLWRLLALSSAHPSEEFLETINDGRFPAAFDSAWRAVTGRAWPSARLHTENEAELAFTAFEAGYIHAFHHGFKGRPVAPILAGEYESVSAGLTRPVLMLNLTGFYKHFGLKAATGDEGKDDEPDHLSVMAEFMAVLCHLEARALSAKRDASPYRRAQRDFLARYLRPFLSGIAERLSRDSAPILDPITEAVFADMTAFSNEQVPELEARVGPYRDPDTAKPSAVQDNSEPATQNLWG